MSEEGVERRLTTIVAADARKVRWGERGGRYGERGCGRGGDDVVRAPGFVR